MNFYDCVDKAFKRSYKAEENEALISAVYSACGKIQGTKDISSRGISSVLNEIMKESQLAKNSFVIVATRSVIIEAVGAYKRINFSQNTLLPNDTTNSFDNRR